MRRVGVDLGEGVRSLQGADGLEERSRQAIRIEPGERVRDEEEWYGIWDVYSSGE